MTLQSLLTTWSFDPLVLFSLAAAALLYVRGVAYTSSIGLGPRLQWWQISSYFIGLLVVYVALQSEVDIGSGQLLWIHMIQHELLTMVAPPLILLGNPSWILWRAFPASWRRELLMGGMRLRWPWRFGHALGRLASNPPLVLALFLGDFLIWHIPVFYDLTLYNHNIHIAEHLLFLGTAVLFWAQVIPTSPQRRPTNRLTLPSKATTHRLSYPMQVLYMGCAALVLNVLGGIFVFSVGPIYEYYATLVRTPGMPSVVIDQHLAGVAMDVPGTFIFFTAMMILVGVWLVDDERKAQAESPLTSASRY